MARLLHTHTHTHTHTHLSGDTVLLVLVTATDYPKACAEALRGAKLGVRCSVFSSQALFDSAQRALIAIDQ